MSTLMCDAELGHTLESKRGQVLRLDEGGDVRIASEVEEVGIGEWGDVEEQYEAVLQCCEEEAGVWGPGGGDKGALGGEDGGR